MPSGGNNKLTKQEWINRLKEYTNDEFELPDGYFKCNEVIRIYNKTREIEYFTRIQDFLNRYKKNPNYPDVEENVLETKYTKEYCQELLNKYAYGYKVLNVVYGRKTVDHYCVVQCKNPKHKLKIIKCFHLKDYKYQCTECIIDSKIEEIKVFLTNTKYEYVDFEYIYENNRYIVHMKDKNYFYTIEWKNLKNCATPLIVGSSNPYSTINVIKYLELNIDKFTYLSGNYIDQKSSFICKCSECNEEFDISWDSISQNRGCPYCAGVRVCDNNSFVINYPELAVEIDLEKTNIDINSITVGSGKEIWFKCPDCQTSYLSSARSRRHGNGCPPCGIKRRSGENSPNWNGGISEIYKYLRIAIEPWKFDTSNYYNGRCVISNKTSKKVIHHLSVPFAKIVEECFDELGIEKRKTIGEFSEGEVKELSDLCLKKHYKYGLGVVLHRELHNEFHGRYGNKNNTREQFIEFALDKGLDLRKTI